MTELNALTANRLIDKHYAAVEEYLDRATRSADPECSRLVALADAHLRAIAVVRQFRP